MVEEYNPTIYLNGVSIEEEEWYYSFYKRLYNLSNVDYLSLYKLSIEFILSFCLN